MRLSEQRAESRLGFFDRKKARTVISQIARSRALTLFAGAGVSLNRGNPDWARLVSVLLEERLGSIANAIPDFQIDPSILTSLSTIMVSSGGPLIAASMVEQLFEDAYPVGPRTRLEHELHKHLYESWAERLSLASDIAQLAVVAKHVGCNVHIVTTNFDDNVEESTFGHSELMASFKSRYPLKSIDNIDNLEQLESNDIPVVHVHGLLSQDDPQPNFLVFSEGDLTSWMVRGTRRSSSDDASTLLSMSDYLIDRLSTSTSLFMGTSLRDTNVVHALLATKATAKRPDSPPVQRYAVAPIQDDMQLLERANILSPESVTLVDRCITSRLRHLDVKPVRPDFYGQVSQFLHELALYIMGAANYPSNQYYSERIRKWWDEWEASSSNLAVEHLQTELQKLVLSLTDRGFIGDYERVRAELWVRCEPDERELVKWAASDAILVGDDRPSVPIRHQLINPKPRYAAFEAFAARGAHAGQIDKAARSQWTNYVAATVVLRQAPWYELPVGVVTLLLRHSRPYGTGRIIDPHGKDRTDDIAAALSSLGEDLLSPPPEDPTVDADSGLR